MGLYEQVDYDFSGPLQPQDLFDREYVTMGGVIDHHLTTIVQSHTKMPKKPVVITTNGLFPVLTVNVQSQQNSCSNASLYHPVVVLRPGRPVVRILPVAPKKGRCIAVQRPFLFCHGSVIVNPSFDYVRGNIGHDRHEKTDKIAHGISFPCWFCTSGSTRAILSVFVFIKNPIQSFGRQS